MALSPATRPRRRKIDVDTIIYRQARQADMVGCARVFVRSSQDLARRQGTALPQRRAADIAPSLAHLQRTDPRGFHVAVKHGRVVAFASTIVRGNTHFLSMFWAIPGLQSRGVGRRLLTRAFEGPRPPASAVRCVFASLDPRAQVLYLKFGMRPRGMFYLLKGAPNPSPRPRHAVDLEQVGKVGRTSPQMLAIAAGFDRTFRAARRDADIRYVMGLPGARFFIARAGRAIIGYAVVNEKGRVGPAGVVDPRFSAGLAWAIKEAARTIGAKELFVVVPGVNAGALSTFFEAGLKTEFFGAWMSAKPVGSFEGYLLAGGMLL
jgi:GNAT superfamily N-acetyltransferase